MNAVAMKPNWTTADDMAELAVLDVADCQRALAAIDALRASWTQRHPMLPFFTLGAASYIDAARSRDGYKAAATAGNPLIESRFGWLLECVRSSLESTLGAPVAWNPDAALPGFHIYLAHKMFEQPIASIHCDSQYELVDWTRCGTPDFTRAASFTLALALPRHGGGLNVWDVNRSDITGLDNVGIGARIRAAKMSYHSYSTGTMVLHSGNVMHQAAPGRDISPEERRITLQGHCQRVGDRWFAYW